MLPRREELYRTRVVADTVNRVVHNDNFRNVPVHYFRKRFSLLVPSLDIENIGETSKHGVDDCKRTEVGGTR